MPFILWSRENTREHASEWHSRLLSRAALACLLATPPNGELARRIGTFHGVLRGLIVRKQPNAVRRLRRSLFYLEGFDLLLTRNLGEGVQKNSLKQIS